MRVRKALASITALAVIVPISIAATTSPANADEALVGGQPIDLWVDEDSFKSKILSNGSTQSRINVGWDVFVDLDKINSEDIDWENYDPASEERDVDRFTLEGFGPQAFEWADDDGCVIGSNFCNKTLTTNNALQWGTRTLTVTGWKGEEKLGSSSTTLTVNRPTGEWYDLSSQRVTNPKVNPNLKVSYEVGDEYDVQNAPTGLTIGIKKTGTSKWRTSKFKINRKGEYVIKPLAVGVAFDVGVAITDGYGTTSYSVKKNRKPPKAPKGKPAVKFQGSFIARCSRHGFNPKPQRFKGGIVNKTKTPVYMLAPKSKKWILIDRSWKSRDIVRRITKPGTYKFISVRIGSNGLSKASSQRKLKITKKMIRARAKTFNDCSFWAL